MSTDFSKYQSIIEQLRGDAGSTNFEAKFTSLTQNLTKKDQFLLKMEVKRLAAPCTRLVDLRGLVNGECRLYEHGERSHYLDETAIKIFEENVAYYGSYTFGVYEAVTNTENNFRVIYQKEKSNIKPVEVKAKVSSDIVEKNQYPAKLYSSEKYFDRREERMNYAVNVNVIVNNKTFEAVTSDISVHGCKLRLTGKEQLHLDQIIQIRFTGLEVDFQFGAQNTFDYCVCNISIIDNIQFVGVCSLDSSEANFTSFYQFLHGYIQGNKRRYKINLDNTIAALHARTFEHYALPKSNELVVFIEQQQHKLAPRYVMTCANNHYLHQYWHDEECHSTLHFLLNEKRLERLEKATKLNQSLLVYCFIHQNNGKYYFYSADEYELKEDKESMSQFLGFAAAKESFCILNLSLNKVYSQLSNSPYLLADSPTVKDHYINLPPTESVISAIDNLPFFITINEVSSDGIRRDYQQLDCEVRDIAKLKQFGHRKTKVVNNIEEIEINYSNQRQEVRFIYNTPVVITKSGVTWSGNLKDFSVSGLKIELDKAAVLSKGEIVYLNLPVLQKMTSKFVLQKLPYEIVRTNMQKTIVSVRAVVENHQHIGRTFFKFLIDKNKDKLTLDDYDLILPGLPKALRNLYAHSIVTPSLLVQTSGSRYKVESILCGQKQSALFEVMKQISDRDNYYNLYPLLHNTSVLNGLDSSLKKMNSKDAPLIDVIYVSVKGTKESIENKVFSKRENDFESSAAKKIFIKRALKYGDFFCIQLCLSRTKEADMAYLSPELTYISSYAIHRAKQLEQEIWSVAGVIQLFDITNEAMMRYKLL